MDRRPSIGIKVPNQAVKLALVARAKSSGLTLSEFVRASLLHAMTCPTVLSADEHLPDEEVPVGYDHRT